MLVFQKFITIATKVFNFLARDFIIEFGYNSPSTIETSLTANQYNEDYANNYFESRRIERKVFMDNLLKWRDYRTINFCSIGCGFGGEESLLQDKVNNLVLIEPDVKTYNFLKKKFTSNNTVLINQRIEDFHSQLLFDIIYTSSPSNWMNLMPWSGIPEDYFRILYNNLKEDGVFIARIYGGMHKESILRSNHYLNMLINTTRNRNYNVLSYSKEKYSYLLVLSKLNLNNKVTPISFDELSQILIKDSIIIGKNTFRFSKNISMILRLCTYISLRLLLDIVKTIKYSFYIGWTNFKLILDPFTRFHPLSPTTMTSQEMGIKAENPEKIISNKPLQFHN